MPIRQETRKQNLNHAPADRAASTELLWGERIRTSPGRKPALSIEQIVTAAISIADREGLSTISMQRVAASLGFTTMSLYRYVPGKAELIDLMVDTALGPPPSLSESMCGWRPRLDKWAHSISAAFYKHPWALQATSRLRPTGPNELGWMEAAIKALSETGLGCSDQLDVLRVIMGQVRIVVQYTVTFPDAEPGLNGVQWQSGIAELVEKRGSRYPTLRACLRSSSGLSERQVELDLGLQCALDGIAVLIERCHRVNAVKQVPETDSRSLV